MIAQALIAHYKELGYEATAAIVNSPHNDRIFLKSTKTKAIVEIIISETRVILYKHRRNSDIMIVNDPSTRTPIFTVDLIEPDSLQQLEIAIHAATT